MTNQTWSELSSNAKKVLDIANASAWHLYCKHDGSLNEGFELVTHPMTVEYHCAQMPWREVLTCLKEMGYRSHQTSTAGLHIHVNRDSLGSTWQEQEETIARILYLVEKFWEELVKFSRRSLSQLDRWAARYGFKECPKDILKCAKGGYGRYASVNLCNENTIEFRIFRVRLLTPHSCRHTYVSQMQALGIDIQTIQSIVGHACTDMTEHYLHVQDSIRQNAVNRFSEVFAFSENPSN